LPTRLLRVALTGGIATGKSFCLARFAELGASTIDADGLARHAIAAGTAGYDRVIARFGAAILKADGSLDREALGALVFSDLDARRALEGIIHPVVYAAIERWFDGHSKTGHVDVAIADIPLLFETRREGEFDQVVVASCPVALQKARLMERNGLSEAEADRRIASQIPVEEKAAKADHVIDTSGTFDETTRQVREVWTKLRNAASLPR
jgi:dephospho-CoA kinase